MTNFLLMFSLSTLAIILGFVALLTQKIYVDPATNQPTEVDIPFVGKIKTNIPALVFVILGFSMAYIAYDKSLIPRKTQWLIEGKFTSDKENMVWENGSLVVFPMDYKVSVYKDGKYTIEANIEEGKTFEDVIRYIDYSHPEGSKKIYPRQEYSAFIEKKETLLEAVEDNIRNYKTTPIKLYQGG